MEGKTIKLVSNANTVTSYTQGKEFVNVLSIVADKLKEKKHYSDELIQGLIQQVTALVNSPYAIQRQPSLTETSKAKFLVALKATKGGSYCCTLNKTHVTCVCNSYKYDSVCKHSIAVSLRDILECHLQSIKQGTGGSRARLVTPVNDNCAGKKGHKAKNPWRAPCSCQTPASTSHQNTTEAPEGFTPAVHHNDKPFVVTFIDDAPKAQECRTCKTSFIRRTKILPFDIVLRHEER